MKTTSLSIIGCFLLIQSALAQKTNDQLQQELDQMKLQMVEKSKALGDVIASNNVSLFFINQANAIRSAAIRCERTVETIFKAKAEMNNLDDFYRGIKSAKSLLEVYRVLSLWQLKDIQYVERYAGLYQQLRADAQRLSIYPSYASLTQQQLLHMFPPVSLVFDVEAYSDSLWFYFSKKKQAYQDVANYRYKRCKEYDWDVESTLRQRTANLQAMADKVAAQYISQQKEEITKSIQDQYKVSDEITYVLGARKLIGGAIDEYNKAILLRSDYYRAVAWLDAADQLCVLMMNMPVTQMNQGLKEQVSIEVHQKKSVIDQARKTVSEQPAYRWVEARYRLLSEEIKSRKRMCNQSCKSNLEQANRLIGAALVMNKTGNQELFSVLAHEALDNVEGVK